MFNKCIWYYLSIFCNNQVSMMYEQQLNSHFSWTNKHILRAKLFPSLKEVLWGHLCGLEKLVQSDGQFDSNVLESASIPVMIPKH